MLPARGYYLVNVRALVRMVRQSNGQALSKFEEHKCEYEIHVGLSNKKSVVQMLADSAIRLSFHDVIVSRLQSDIDFRKRISGSKWSIEVRDLSTKMDQSVVLS